MQTPLWIVNVKARETKMLKHNSNKIIQFLVITHVSRCKPFISELPSNKVHLTGVNVWTEKRNCSQPGLWITDSICVIDRYKSNEFLCTGLSHCQYLPTLADHTKLHSGCAFGWTFLLNRLQRFFRMRAFNEVQRQLTTIKCGLKVSHDLYYCTIVLM